MQVMMYITMINLLLAILVAAPVIEPPLRTTG